MGHAPDLATLSALAGRSEKETEEGLRQLEQMHGVMLFRTRLRRGVSILSGLCQPHSGSRSTNGDGGLTVLGALLQSVQCFVKM
jgi:hypothetical protein